MNFAFKSVKKIMRDFEIFSILRAVHSERFENLPSFTGKAGESDLRFYLKSRSKKQRGVWGIIPNSM